MTELLLRFVEYIKRLFPAAVRKGDPPQDVDCAEPRRPLPPSPARAAAGGGPSDG